MKLASFGTQESATAALLLRDVPAISPDLRLDTVLRLFADDPSLSMLPVVEEGRPVGLICRRVLVERFARPFARELAGRKPISEFMDRRPLVVSVTVDLDSLSKAVINNRSDPGMDGFILVEQGGNYAGIGSGFDLMRVLAERKQARLYELAHYDSLTGLPNRLLFHDRLHQVLANARRNGASVALLFIDLDRFKLINDTLGHASGDLLLKEVAERVSSVLREGDTVARMSGDEFSVILPGAGELQHAATVAQKVLDALAPPVLLIDHGVVVTASIGIAIYPHDDRDDDGTGLLRKADAAMYRAKEQGKNNYQFYKAEMNVDKLERLLLEHDLRHALEQGQFFLQYQPRYEVSGARMTGMEALVRWRHPQLGVVPPDRFIPLAEDTGLIIPLGEWVIRTACRQNKTWQEKDFRPLRVSVNLSGRQLKQRDLVATVARILAETSLAPEWLEFELTETIAMENTETTQRTLVALKEMGVRLAIDDFGTGYSSLSYLKRFAFDSLKIDQSFVRDVTTNTEDALITRAISAMASSLGLRTVAEGVETAEQREYLDDIGCDEMQGYLLSRPVDAGEFEGMLLRQADPASAQNRLLPPTADGQTLAGPPNGCHKPRADVIKDSRTGAMMRTVRPPKHTESIHVQSK